MIDIIFVSKGESEKFILMTQKAIDTAIENTELKVNCLVMEQLPGIKYKNAKTINYKFEFNYNKVLNYGVSITKNKYILLANNDLVFYKNWAEELIKGMDEHLSASPLSKFNPHGNIATKGNHEGYERGKYVMGWAIFVKRKIFDVIGKLDESYKFWSSDNIYVEQLKEHKIKHVFVTGSHVEHVTSATLNISDAKNELTHKEHNKFKMDLNYKKTFSIIMPSFLGQYPRCASNRNEKFIRAIKSIQNQTFDDWELIIISDGCDITTKLYLDNFEDDERIYCYKIKKQKIWSGNVRHAGISKAEGKYICYLDTDDYFNENHLELIQDKIIHYDWAYMSEWALTDEGMKERDVELQLSSSGTSSIVHRSNLKSTWKGCNEHTHDWCFIQKLIKESMNFGYIERCGYVVCHTQWSFDN